MGAYRSYVVGSLLRPGYLKAARERHTAGELDDAAFKAIEDRAVDEVIALQIDAGLDVVTDGEMRRYAFFGHLIDATEGFDKFSARSSSRACGRAATCAPRSSPICAPAPPGARAR